MRSSRFIYTLAALALGALTSVAPAQTPLSTIYWKQTQTWPNPSNHYKYPIRSTSAQFQTFPTESGNPSARSTYPGGRQFFVQYDLDPFFFGFVPGTDIRRSVLLLMSEKPTAPSVAVTFGAFANGPEYLANAHARWTSSGTDSFFTFEGYNATTNVRRVFRYNGPMSALFSPTFVPFSPADILVLPPPAPPPRLTVVTTFANSSSFSNDWNSNGRKLVFSTPSPFFGFVTSVFDTTTSTTTVVNNPAVTGVSLVNPVFSPTDPNQLFAVAETQTGQQGSARGLASIVLPTNAFRWILLEGGVGNARLWNFTSPQVSPDGQQLAFTLNRVTKINILTGPAPSLATISIRGGVPTFLWTQGLNLGTNPFEVTGWTPTP